MFGTDGMAFCENCNVRIPEDEEFFTDDDVLLCEDCFNQLEDLDCTEVDEY